MHEANICEPLVARWLATTSYNSQSYQRQFREAADRQ